MLTRVAYPTNRCRQAHGGILHRKARVAYERDQVDKGLAIVQFRDRMNDNSGTGPAASRETEFNVSAKARTSTANAESPECVNGQFARGKSDRSNGTPQGNQGGPAKSQPRNDTAGGRQSRCIGYRGNIAGGAFEGQRLLLGRQRWRSGEQVHRLEPSNAGGIDGGNLTERRRVGCVDAAFPDRREAVGVNRRAAARGPRQWAG